MTFPGQVACDSVPGSDIIHQPGSMLTSVKLSSCPSKIPAPCLLLYNDPGIYQHPAKKR